MNIYIYIYIIYIYIQIYIYTGIYIIYIYIYIYNVSPAFSFKHEYIKVFCRQKLDGHEQHLLHNIFKTDQKVTEYTSDDVPANIYWFKVNKGNARSRRRSNVFILISEHNSHNFRVTIADFKQEKVYLDSFFCYETISIYIDFFQTIKRCCQVHVQTTSFI